MSTSIKKDYYAILGISKTATTEEIKAAYKKQALQWHPDKNPTLKEYAEEKFKEVSEAYANLSDPTRRSRYDLYGDADYNPNTNIQTASPTSFGSFGVRTTPLSTGFFGGGFTGFTFERAEQIFKEAFGNDFRGTSPLNGFQTTPNVGLGPNLASGVHTTFAPTFGTNLQGGFHTIPQTTVSPGLHTVHGTQFTPTVGTGIPGTYHTTPVTTLNGGLQTTYVPTVGMGVGIQPTIVHPTIQNVGLPHQHQIVDPFALGRSHMNNMLQSFGFRDPFFGNNSPFGGMMAEFDQMHQQMMQHMSLGGGLSDGFTGASQSVSSSTIIRDGQQVTVTKTTRTNPDGTSHTEVHERAQDAGGRVIKDQIYQGQPQVSQPGQTVINGTRAIGHNYSPTYY